MKDRPIAPPPGKSISLDQLTLEAALGRTLCERNELIIKMNQGMQQMSQQVAEKDAEIERQKNVIVELEERIKRLQPRAVDLRTQSDAEGEQ